MIAWKCSTILNKNHKPVTCDLRAVWRYVLLSEYVPQHLWTKQSEQPGTEWRTNSSKLIYIVHLCSSDQVSVYVHLCVYVCACMCVCVCVCAQLYVLNYKYQGVNFAILYEPTLTSVCVCVCVCVRVCLQANAHLYILVCFQHSASCKVLPRPE